jgi:hypothetical protein
MAIEENEAIAPVIQRAARNVAFWVGVLISAIL